MNTQQPLLDRPPSSSYATATFLTGTLSLFLHPFGGFLFALRSAAFPVVKLGTSVCVPTFVRMKCWSSNGATKTVVTCITRYLDRLLRLYFACVL